MKDDVEPDFDELFDGLTDAEYAKLVDGTCERCGRDGHEGKDCDVITPVLLKPWDDPVVVKHHENKARRRRHARKEK